MLPGLDSLREDLEASQPDKLVCMHSGTSLFQPHLVCKTGWIGEVAGFQRTSLIHWPENWLAWDLQNWVL